MKNISFVFVAAVSLAAFGCKKGADCAKAINNGMEVGKADLPTDEAIKTKMKDMGMQHCKDDKWSDDAIKCMAEAKTAPEGRACYSKLSPEQQQKMNKAAMDMMQPAAGSAGSAAATDPGSAGSAADMGSGSAGSATAPK